MNFEKKLFLKQKLIIYKLKNYLRMLEYSSVNSSLSSMSYFYPGGGVPGYIKIKFFESFKEGMINFNHYFKSCLSHLIKSPNLKITQKMDDKKYNEIVLTWGEKKQFKLDGSFNDKYFKINSKTDPKKLWIVIVDEACQNTNSNIIQIEENLYKKLNLKNFFKQLFKTFWENKFSLIKLFHYFPYHSLFAKNISQILTKLIKENKINKILLPYEPQPFQQYLIQNTKKIDKKIKVVGYIHSALSSFPTDYIFRDIVPDKVLVHGEGQIEILRKKLFWPKKKLKLITSQRYKLNSHEKFKKNFIYLPYQLIEGKKLLYIFDKFLEKERDFTFNQVGVSSHPKTKNFKNNLVFVNKLKKVLKKNKKKFSSKKNKMNINFCFGSSSVILELLESKKKVIQITSNPLYDIFNSFIWKHISIKKINDNVFLYRLKKYGKYIKK
jgi:hypothetical protein|tara:strand:- start:2690 stop:4003 length:1314 start_codon:yes stop_codon:yes gene_type:complete